MVPRLLVMSHILYYKYYKCCIKSCYNVLLRISFTRKEVSTCSVQVQFSFLNMFAAQLVESRAVESAVGRGGREMVPSFPSRNP